LPPYSPPFAAYLAGGIEDSAILSKSELKIEEFASLPRIVLGYPLIAADEVVRDGKWVGTV